MTKLVLQRLRVALDTRDDVSALVTLAVLDGAVLRGGSGGGDNGGDVCGCSRRVVVTGSGGRRWWQPWQR
eukprot:364480-Chlamydomonas_euryale.AAC.15